MHHDFEELKGFSYNQYRAWLYKDPNVWVLQALAYEKVMRSLGSIPTGGNIFHWIFCFQAVISLMPILASLAISSSLWKHRISSHTSHLSDLMTTYFTGSASVENYMRTYKKHYGEWVSHLRLLLGSNPRWTSPPTLLHSIRYNSPKPALSQRGISFELPITLSF